MELKVYNALRFYNSIEEFEKDCFHRLTNFHWESDPPYRPNTYFKMGVVGDDLVAKLQCYEENPRAVFENRDDPMYLDSCLEFFVAPVEGRAEYVNVESNSKGAFLCEFGDGKYNRRLCADLTELSPIVESFSGNDENGSYWGVKVELTKAFICSIYNCNDFSYGIIRANFYKCGDDCDIQHYIAFAPVTTLPPGFHNPDCFMEFKRSI